MGNEETCGRSIEIAPAWTDCTFEIRAVRRKVWTVKGEFESVGNSAFVVSLSNDSVLHRQAL